MKKWIVVPLLILSVLSGCTSEFFQPTNVLYRKPEDLGLKYDVARFHSLDGTPLTGIFIHASGPTVLGTVIHFHGNGENMSSHFIFSYWLAARGYNVFIFDYRGYGASKGTPSVKGAIEDGEAAIAYVLKRPDANPERVAVWGQSLGGDLAIASVSQGRFKNLKALIIESAFDSYPGMAQDVLSRNALTWILSWPLSRLLISDSGSPSHYLKSLPHCPILVIAGTEDKTVPERLTRKLYRELPQPKQFWEIPGGGHLDAFSRLGAVNRPRLAAFLNHALGVSRAPKSP